MKHLQIPERAWRMLVDGDDAVLVVEHDYVGRCQSLPGIFSGFSQEVKVTEASRVSLDRMEVIEFCQSRPVLVGDRWRIIRNPYKVYNGYKQQVLYYMDIHFLKRFLGTIAGPEGIYARGVPVHQELFRALGRLAGAKFELLESVQRRFWIRHCHSIRDKIPESDVTWVTRLSYERAFGIGPLMQIQIEEDLRDLREDFLPSKVMLQ
jgi:hypothetical protein